MPARPPPYPQDIRPLTSLRAAAAGWVLLHHLVPGLPSSPAWLARLADAGYLGVDFFFVLSGFILAHVYLPRLREGRFAYGDFLRRRVARIYPLHLVMLLVGVTLYAASQAAGLPINHPEGYTAGGLAASLLLAQAWGLTGIASWNGPSWSISAEWAAYLLFPALAALALAPRTGRAALAAAAAGLVAADLLCRALLGAGVTTLTSLGALRVLPEFVLGVALYRVGLDAGLPAGAARAAAALAAAGAAAVALLGLPDLAAVGLLAALILAAAELGRRGTAGPLGAGPAVYLGEVSYALYLVHVPAIAVATRALPWAHVRPDGAAGALLTAAACVAAACAAHHLVEVPGRALLTRGAAGRRGDRAVAA